MQKSYRVALGGMITALAVICMFLTGFIPVGTYALPTVAGSLLLIIAVEFDFKWAYLVFAAISILSLLVVPDREAAILFVTFFGHYPTTKLLIEKIPAKIACWAIKLLLFNVSMILSFYGMIYILGFDAILQEFSDWGKYGLWIFLLMGNVVFVIMDIALSRLKTFYLLRIRKKLLHK